MLDPRILAVLLAATIFGLGYAAGRVRPVYELRDRARWFIRTCTGEERFFRARAWLAFLLLIEDHWFRLETTTPKRLPAPQIGSRWRSDPAATRETENPHG